MTHSDLKTPIRILLLEDSAIDAELIAAQLSAARMDVDIHRIWTRNDFVKALNEGSYDVILADHVLPGFDGDSALEITQELKPELPFIFVSGTLTEELAVQALKRGARDYVVKQRLQRLSDAIGRAMVETQERAKLERAQDALRQSQERLQVIANSLPVLIAHVDLEHRYQFNNNAYFDWFGVTPAQLHGRHLRELAGDLTYEKIRPFLSRALDGERVSFETKLELTDSKPRYVHIDYVPERHANGAVLGCYALVHDISERKSAELALLQMNESLEKQVLERTDALRQSEAQLQAIFQSSFQHQSLLARDGVLLDTNVASLQVILHTKAQVCGHHFWDTPWFSGNSDVSRLVRGMVEKAAQGGESSQEITLNLPSGKRSFDFSMRPLRNHEGEIFAIVSEAVETTARRQAEEALRQSQKMEAVGQLTGGIAHDFNNLLTVIGGNVDRALTMADRSGAMDSPLQRALENADKGVRRAASLTKRLLAFSRRQPLQNQLIDVNEMLRGMMEMLRRVLGETVQLELIAHPDAWCVEADPNQLESSILNLAVNARDAMHNGGKLTIEVTNIHLDQNYSQQHAEVIPGRYVVISVADTGDGMDDETLGRVFEPFFTTKEVGRGTGLGLSMVYGFIKQSGGHVQIHSKPGTGTTVALYLPRSLNTLPDRKQDSHSTSVQHGSADETILVVEDNDDVRAYTVECLRGLGYRVLEAHDGESALRLLDRRDISIDLLFSDMVMPGMMGRELAERARHIYPQLRILFTSGYPKDDLVLREGSVNSVTILAKPFTQSSVALSVRAALDHAPKIVS